MAQDDYERTLREHGLEKSSPDQVGRRFLQQTGLAEIPISGPLLKQLFSALWSNQSGLVSEVRRLVETKPARASIEFSRGKHSLQMLAFVFRNAGISESADRRMFAQNSKQRGRAAAVKATKEDEPVIATLTQ